VGACAPTAPLAEVEVSISEEVYNKLDDEAKTYFEEQRDEIRRRGE
jgi:hypothetical protein